MLSRQRIWFAEFEVLRRLQVHAHQQVYAQIPKPQKVELTVIFVLLESVSVKAARKMLVKLTIGTRTPTASIKPSSRTSWRTAVVVPVSRNSEKDLNPAFAAENSWIVPCGGWAWWEMKIILVSILATNLMAGLSKNYTSGSQPGPGGPPISYISKKG